MCVGRRWVCGAIEVGWSGVRIERKEKREKREPKSNTEGRRDEVLIQMYITNSIPKP